MGYNLDPATTAETLCALSYSLYLIGLYSSPLLLILWAEGLEIVTCLVEILWHSVYLRGIRDVILY